MHPPLNRTGSLCAEEAAALKLCHSAHPYSKFWGVCNDQKLALDACFRNEKKLKRAANAVRAAREKERLAARKARATES